MGKISENYWAPTSKKMRRLGDGLLLISTSLSGYSVVDGWEKYFTIIIMITGVLGKFLTNFFTE